MDITKANSSVNPLAIFGGFCYSDVAYDMYGLHETDLFGTGKSIYVARDNFIATALQLEEIMTPFILEYSLMVAGILHSISKQMMRLEDLDPSIAARHTARDCGESFDTPNTNGSSSCIHIENNTVSGSQPGLIFGILFGLILIASSLTFSNSHPDNSRRSQDFFLVYEGLLGFMQLIVIIIISQSLHHHSMHEHEIKPDDWLLILGFLGVFAFDLMGGYSAAKSLTDKDKRFARENIIILIQVILLVFSRVLQTGVIIFSRRYVPKLSRRRFRRSAARIRQCALFLFTTNLCFWTFDSFIEIRDTQSTHPAGREIFGDKWVTIVALTYPLTIFFRFHAAAMLFELWARFKFHPKED
eukprot:Seg1010.12 transcript_id=Seg1010.12/GoldUCD/mRNA.D3Y31 product="Proton channel OTOP1" protein_id=Seg1010.12/GoldUCD/D3Y31